VQEQELGGTLDRSELAALVRTSYDLVVAKLPKSRRPGAVQSRRATPDTASSSSSAPRQRRSAARPKRRR